MTGSVSQSDDSDGPSSNSKSSEQKKKERIRDNQRRSRARRQEHVADLERRLVACQNTVREADMQRTAFRDARIENTRLRSLLKVAGVHEGLIQSYVNRGINQAQNADSGHRHIRPRIPEPPGEDRQDLSTQASSSPFDISAMSRLSVDPELENTMSHLSPSPLSQVHSPHSLQGLSSTSHLLGSDDMQQPHMLQPSLPPPDTHPGYGEYLSPPDVPYRY